MLILDSEWTVACIIMQIMLKSGCTFACLTVRCSYMSHSNIGFTGEGLGVRVGGGVIKLDKKTLRTRLQSNTVVVFVTWPHDKKNTI